MYNFSGLIPTRFLSLIAHLTVCISLIWSQQSVTGCSVTKESSTYPHQQLIVGLSISLGLIAFEFITFLSGVTMFHSTSSLISISGHCSATIALTYFILDKWQCGWFWWVFTLCSVLPAATDLFVMCDVYLRGKW